ncbi:MAG: transposase [Bacteroidota bacterium]|nr:transposase [Bacteroidota bacterium]
MDIETLKLLFYQKNWVVYCQKPFAGPEGIIRYLGNYTHRVAISNHRIEAFENDKVSLSYKDYKTEGMKKTLPWRLMSLSGGFCNMFYHQGFIKSGILVFWPFAT